MLMNRPHTAQVYMHMCCRPTCCRIMDFTEFICKSKVSRDAGRTFVFASGSQARPRHLPPDHDSTFSSSIDVRIIQGFDLNRCVKPCLVFKALSHRRLVAHSAAKNQISCTTCSRGNDMIERCSVFQERVTVATDSVCTSLLLPGVAECFTKRIHGRRN